MDNTHNNNNMSSKQIPSDGEQPIGVQLSVAPGSSSSVNGKDHSIFVGGLSIDTTNASLSAYFSKFGKVENCKVVRHVKNKHSRCFGFVTFVCTQTAAIISGGPHTIDGKVVDVKQMENQQPKNKLGNKRTRKNIQSRGESKVKGIKQEFSKKEVDEKRGTNKKKDVLESINDSCHQSSYHITRPTLMDDSWHESSSCLEQSNPCDESSYDSCNESFKDSLFETKPTFHSTHASSSPTHVISRHTTHAMSRSRTPSTYASSSPTHVMSRHTTHAMSRSRILRLMPRVVQPM
ncbi:hypothetical protein niasHT_038802 [Heterodera trifolii]|uniref:RRM domain-containing protein n=1 Tax=Heterodera trifolii TaxID=157864 RepID=A0ABD2HZU5_9BILA